MIVTVKTLDSETRSFTVSDEASVEEFKRQIAESVGIPADRQRLIFKGKVLQDEHKLQEYQVDGCVVHLVERKPPTTGRTRPDGASAASSAGSGTQTTPNLMGPFTIPPLDVMGISQNIVQGIVNQLGVDTTNTNISTHQSMDGGTLNVHINLVAPAPSANDVNSRITRARKFLQDARNSLNRVEGAGPPQSETDGSSGSSCSGDQPNNTSGSQRQEQPRPGVLADIFQELQEFHNSMQPAIDRYSELLNSQSTENLLPSDDSLPDRIAETLHNLSHAYHALSDVTYNTRAPEPRHLRLLTPLSPHVGPPQLLSQFLNRTQASSGPGSTTQVGPGSTTQSGPAQTSAPTQTPVSTSGATRVHVSPQSSTIAFTSIITSTLPRPGTTQASTAATNVSGSTSGISTGATTNSHPRNDPTTSASATGTTSSTTEGTAHQSEDMRVVMDDFIAIVSNFGATTPSETQQSTTPATPASYSSTSTSQPSAQAQSQAQPQSSLPRYRMNTPQVHRRMANHPDPTVPCESFHFGPRAQRGASHTPSAPRVRQSPEALQRGRDLAAQYGIPPIVHEAIRSLVEGAMTSGAREANGQTQQPRGTANAATNTSTSSSSATQTTTPAGDSVMDSLMRLLSGIQGEGDPQLPPLLTPGSTTGNTAGSQNQEASATLQSGINPHDLRDAVMRDLVLDAYGRVARGEDETGPYHSINDVILEMQNRGLDTGPDQMNVQGVYLSQLITRFGTSMSIQDTLGIMMGLPESTLRFRDVLCAYLYTDLLLGDEATDANIERVSREFVSQLLASVEPLLTPERSSDNIDVQATVRRFFEDYILTALKMIRDNSEAMFCLQFPDYIRDMCADCVILLTMCYEGGQDELLRMITDRLPLTLLARDMGPAMIRTFQETVTRYVRDTCAHRAHARDTLQRFIVKKEPADQRMEAAARPSEPQLEVPTPDNIEDTSVHSDDSDAFHTPPGSVVNNALEEERKPSGQGDVDMELDEEQDWKAVVPEDWVPIIAQDVVRQRRLSSQQPFSDAYLSGMPPKRRKTADERAVCPTEETVPTIIRQAILATGATPRTSLDAVMNAARQNTELHDTYRDEVQRTVKRRIDNDSDYTPERFPNTRDYVEKNQRKQ